jgi:hypothetical protein
MAVTISARGTSYKSFKIGKKGTTLFQGAIDPSGTETVSTGDLWIDTNASAIRTWGGSNWSLIKFDNIALSGNEIAASGNLDLTSTGVITINGVEPLTSASLTGYATESYVDSSVSALVSENSLDSVLIQASGTIVRSAKLMEINRVSSTSDVSSISQADFTEGDVLVFNKGQQSGSWTINLTGSSFIYPDNTTDTSMLFPEGCSFTVKITKRSDTNFEVYVL